ncbi:polyketide hydroxylase [Streptomyces ipomoeae]|nr:polyketide hydroxylase [Streptomyces ipomoeae]
MITALDVRYPVDDTHPLSGRRVPDIDLETTTGPTRVFELLHSARPVLLDLRARTATGGDADLTAAVDGTPDLTATTEGTGPAALLIRPDGHIAWTAPGGAPVDIAALRTALTTWFGPATTDRQAAPVGVRSR